MIELVPDPEFDNANLWSIQQGIPPIPTGTQISFGKLIVGIDLIPPSLILGNCIVSPVSDIGAVIGAKYDYSITIDQFTAASSAGISYGGVVLWDKTDGAGEFIGSMFAVNTNGLYIYGSSAGYIVDRVSIMANSIRELILQSLTNQLDNITTANGYDFNIAASSVVRARRKFFDTDLPAIGIFDGEETQTSDYNDTRAEMLVRVEMHADAGATNRSTVMNQMMANLEKAILIQDTTHSGIAGGTVIDSIEQRLPDDDDSTLVTVVAVIRITYHKITGNPYSNP